MIPAQPATGGNHMETRDRKYAVNLFRPSSAYMRGEVFAIFLVLALWGSASFGFQLWLALSTGSAGKSWLETFTFFNLPFHFWFTAQMLPLWFIMICVLFNLFIDRLADRQNRNRDGYDD
jgi:putative solute:sodium symporter small subunit